MQTSWLGKTWNITNDHFDLEAFLKSDQNNEAQVHDFKQLKDINKATERILRAIKDQEKIMIFGDFDTDGITATVILVHGLKSLGAQVSYRIPERSTDSHGLKNHLIDEIHKTGTTLIITCDCGINDQSPVKHAKDLGLEVIITDHHTSDPKRFPKDAFAVVNPQQAGCLYPNKETSGSVIAYKLIQSLHISSLVTEGQSEISTYLELAIIGLIADCMPITEENHLLTKQGLEKIKNTAWPGLKELFKENQITQETINAETVSFTIAPHLNAASRLGDVRQAVELFLGNAEKIPARVQHLRSLNLERRDQTETAQLEAEEQIKPNAKYQMLISDTWGAGIVGLLAGRVCESLGQPVIAARLEPDGTIKASCRSIKSISIIGILNQVSENLDLYGGHDGAAGFQTTVDKWRALSQSLDKVFKKIEIQDPHLEILASLNSDQIQIKTLDQINKLSPFGIGNPMPNFLLKNITVLDIKMMGQHKNHLNLLVSHQGKPQRIVGFFMEKIIPRLTLDQELDLVIQISDNWWQGERKLQLRLVDIKETKIT